MHPPFLLLSPSCCKLVLLVACTFLSPLVFLLLLVLLVTSLRNTLEKYARMIQVISPTGVPKDTATRIP